MAQQAPVLPQPLHARAWYALIQIILLGKMVCPACNKGLQAAMLRLGLLVQLAVVKRQPVASKIQVVVQLIKAHKTHKTASHAQGVLLQRGMPKSRTTKPA